MPIRFRCQDCHSRVKVPEGSQGKQVKCPRCGCIQAVPRRAGKNGHGNDLSVHTRVGSMHPHKSPKRKEALVGAGGHDEGEYHLGGGAPGGLNIPPIDAPGDGAEAPDHAEEQSQEQIAESRRRVQDLFATSSSKPGSGCKTSAKNVASPKPVSARSPRPIEMDGRLAGDQDHHKAGDYDTAAPTGEDQAHKPVALSVAPSDAYEDEQESLGRWTFDFSAEAYPFLRVIPWVLRLTALMLIGPAFKAMLLADDQGHSAVVSLLVLFAGLTLVAVTWTVGEIAQAVRDIALKRVGG